MDKYKYVTGIECPVCGDKIWSRHRHDFRSCECGYSNIDGGRDYIRTVWGCLPPLEVRQALGVVIFSRSPTDEEYEIMNEFNSCMGVPPLIRIRVQGVET